ncbi:nuclear transport factor 2 family protein [Sphingomonas sp.]|uniref:nuclear transport factor 2 family protein n=1 Tax=Sphingomonas sp. TaxID=28214 RepID=UPI003B3BB934
MLLGLLILAAATNNKLPRWEAMPPPAGAEAAVMAPINALLAGLEKRDGAAILAQVMPAGGATSATEMPDGTRTIRHMSWQEFAGGISGRSEEIRETLNDPAVEVDGDIAMVWSRYTFTLGGKVHHCGVDHFDLVRDGGAWKILNITWSSRTTGCENGTE